ncbi:MAG TPA: hypothetical protein VGM41_17950 [Chitinophagaceae bacterium]|jgi:hypothetical protein
MNVLKNKVQLIGRVNGPPLLRMTAGGVALPRGLGQAGSRLSSLI